MEDTSIFVLENIIKLTRASELKFQRGNFKEAIEAKRKAKSILKSQNLDKEITDKFKEELANLYSSKFDLIFDHKLRINELKKKEIVELLESKSEEKYQKGDYKGALKALRRADKYLAK